MAGAHSSNSGNNNLLPIRVLSRSLVKASDTSMEPRVVSVSNLDLFANSEQASIVCLYPKPKDGDFDAVVAVFEASLPTLLNSFYPLAGRIVTNPTSGLPELHCFNQGAELIVGQVGLALASMDYGNTQSSLKKIMQPYPKEVALSVQLLSFACGGFSVVWGNNDLVHDGCSATMILRSWSELARTGAITESIVPNHDRSVFRARVPPSYSAQLGSTLEPYDYDRLVNVLTAADSFVERLYYIDATDIARLRETASAGKDKRSSRVQAVSAHLWKVLASVVASSPVQEKCCRMMWLVDGRRRITSAELGGPAICNYFGNATTFVLEEASVEEIQQKPLSDVAAMVREAISSVDYDDNIQELVDFVQSHKKEKIMVTADIGLGSPTVTQTVFASFPLDTDFGFGQATLAMPIWHHGRIASGSLAVGVRPGGDGSWLVNANVWPRLAAALESDEHSIFKPVTADYLGLIY